MRDTHPEEKRAGTLLLVDDEQDLLEGLARILKEERFMVITTTNPDEVGELVRMHRPDVALTDYKMPKKNGFELLREFSQIAPGMPVVMISAYATSEGVVEAVKQGAFDYLIKPFNADELIVAVRRAMAFATLQGEKEALADTIQEDRFEKSFAGSNRAFLESVALVRKAAHSTANVFISGEPGVGKELAARLIHFHGTRAHKKNPFRTVNCATLEEAPFDDRAGESALWRKLFDVTEGGTLYLTNITALGVALQGKLLTEMQKRRATSAKNGNPPTGTRIIASANQEANIIVDENILLKQLCSALTVVTINLPPLRKRREDLPVLADFFLARIAERETKNRMTLPPETLTALNQYEWPGNIRELESALEEGVARSSGEALRLDDFPENVRASSRLTILDYKTAKKGYLDRFERQYIEELLIACNGNISKASERAGLARMSLYRMMRRVGMNHNNAPGGAATNITKSRKQKRK